MHDLFDDTTLNIFCDASITKRGNETIGCPGSMAVSMVDRSVIDRSTSILRNSTNNESEITAILMAVNQAINFRKNYKNVNIFSDSKISVFGLREWMSSWIKYMQDGVLHTPSGSEVANQQIFIQTVVTIVNNDLYIGLYHQKGHINISKPDAIDQARQVFMRSNGVMLKPEEAHFISKCNDNIDRHTRSTLQLYHPTQIQKLVKPIQYCVDKETYKKFMSLVNHD